MPEISDMCPEPGELASFYAGISEPAEIKLIKETVDAATTAPRHNIILSARSRDGQLAGILRAWTDASDETGQKPSTGRARGIVHEIAVRGDYRGKGVGRALLAGLRERTSAENIDWKGNSFRITANLDRDLSLIRNLYGISLIFGFQKVVESSYLQLVGDKTAASLSPGAKILLITLALVLAAVGIRFFWAVGNIRRCVLQRIVRLDPPKRWVLVLVHFPLLFLHAVLFFFLCRFYQDICVNGLRHGYAFGFILVYLFLLGLNVGWLFLLEYNRTDKGPESLWIRNNAAFMIAGVICLVTLEHYHVTSEWELFSASGLFLLNSVVDFIRARGTYILSDAVSGG
jgi:GNAT superfamily N-acetyltransferase